MTTPQPAEPSSEPMPQQSKHDPAIVAAVATEFYKSIVIAPDALRGRAMSAYTIASAVAVVLVGGVTLGKLDQEPTWVGALAVASVGAWVIVAGLFAFAITFKADKRPAIVAQSTDEFVDDVTGRVIAAAEAIRRRTYAALGATAVAALLTIAALLGLVFHPPVLVSGSIVVTSSEATALQEICPNVTERIEGDIEVASVGADPLLIRPSASECGSGADIVGIPRGSIREENIPIARGTWPIPTLP